MTVKARGALGRAGQAYSSSLYHRPLWSLLRPLNSFQSEVLFYFLKFLFIDLRERKKGEREVGERKEHRCVVPLIYACTGSFLYVPGQEILSATSAHWDDALIN